MTATDFIGLIHVAGFLTGIALYGMLASMSWRGSRQVAVGALGSDRITLSAALLGLIWNAGALLAFGMHDFRIGELSPWATMFSYAALGFLPAVVVDSATRAPANAARPSAIAVAAYGLSAAAAVMLVRSTAATGVVAGSGLRVLTLGYGAILLAIGVTSRRGTGSQRAVTAVALAAFAVSALHLSRTETGTDSWVVELIGHHASLPLVIVILYQDYRFALADLFLKRALSILMLVGAVVAIYGILNHPLAVDGGAPIATPAVLVAAWIGTALLYPLVRRAVDRFVDRVMLGRSDYRALRTELSAALAASATPGEALDVTSATLARALTARAVVWREAQQDAVTAGVGSLVLLDGGSAATIAVPTAEAPAYEIAVGELANGRRLFSDDVAFLDRMALLVARRLDELRVAGERYTRDLREHEMRRLTTEAELRALRAQLDPHFLFNALTTIGYLIPNAPRQALDALYRLTALLRGGLRQTHGEFVPLRDELALIDAYLGIEQARFEDRLRVDLSVPAELLDLPIPPLILQPIVENAIKHGIAPRRRGGTIRIAATASDSAPRRLHLRVVDTGAGVAPGELARRRASRVGLSNLERRLDHYFGGDARLVIDSVPGQGTTVDIWLPISGAVITGGMSANDHHLPTAERPRVTAGS